MPRSEKFNLQLSLRATVSALAIVFVVMVVTTQAAQAQTFKVLHNFTGGADGASPYAGLVMDAAGNLYGTAATGGYDGDLCGGTGCGVVFELAPKGSGWILTPLYLFQGGNDGNSPESRVIFGPDGTLYGTTNSGGVITVGSSSRVAAQFST